jgi:hypothetical protein
MIAEFWKKQSYVVAETVMPGRSGFDFAGSGQAFNTLAAYLFGKVIVFCIFLCHVQFKDL